MAEATELSVEPTPIPGLLVLRLPTPGDSRGWFKENWQRAKMTALGLPDFGPVQHSVSYNAVRGVTRGFHGEPWDKLVSVLSGEAFGCWVDLREGPTFGTTFSIVLDRNTSVFVPRGVGNSFQAITDGLIYSYLVNDHWSADAVSRYSYVNLADETLAVDWPIPLSEATMSEADRNHPRLAETTAMAPRRAIVLGGNGQLGRALRALLPDATYVDLPEFDLGDPDCVAGFDWSPYDVIVNAAAYTAVDLAETDEGRGPCWAANATGVATLARLARDRRMTLVHVSTDYVFDGTREIHTEDEPLSPLGVYGQSKAAGELAAAAAPKHYLLRTSWVVGDGRNFVRTMAELAAKGVAPAVVADQYGRLTFADDLARGIVHLLTSGAAYGTYQLSCSGPVTTWAGIAKRVYELVGADPDAISETTTAAYGEGKAMAPRPVHSTLDLSRIEATGFVPASGDEALRAYLTKS